MNYLLRKLLLTFVLIMSVSAHGGIVLYPRDNMCNWPEGNGDDLTCPLYTQYSWKWVDNFGREAKISINNYNTVNIIWNGSFLGTFPASLNGVSHSGAGRYGERWAFVNFKVNINGYMYYVSAKEFINYRNEDDFAQVTVNGVEYEYEL